MGPSSRRYLRPAEFDQLKQLRERIGITKLAAVLDLPFYTARSMLDVERVSERTMQRVRDHLPAAVARHLTPLPSSRAPSVADQFEPLRPADDELRGALSAMLPYVSLVRLANYTGTSVNTLRAAVAGYRPMRASTLDTLRSQLDTLLQPPHDALRGLLRAPRPNAMRALRAGLLAPLPGMTAVQTEELLLC
jgi:hypothetical protein